MEIILYDSSFNKTQMEPEAVWEAVPVVAPTFKTRNFSKIFKGFAFGLIAVSLFILGAAILPIVSQELSYRFNSKTQAKTREFFPQAQNYEVAIENRKQLAAEEAAKYGVGTEFSIVIPKISAASKIIPNVNPANEEIYKTALKTGVAHASGTKFPGGKGTIYLFAHSTNTLVNVSLYNAVFYLIKELEPGDQVIIFFAGLKYTYRIAEKLITVPEDLNHIKDNSSEEKLILQTCWPPGTTLKRLIIVAERV